MNEPGTSDRPIVPGKSPNKTGTPAAEEMEGRGLAKGNLGQQNAPRTTVRDWENGRHKPTRKKLELIAKTLSAY
jgi:hypothetical protein